MGSALGGLRPRHLRGVVRHRPVRHRADGEADSCRGPDHAGGASVDPAPLHRPADRSRLHVRHRLRNGGQADRRRRLDDRHRRSRARCVDCCLPPRVARLLDGRRPPSPAASRLRARPAARRRRRGRPRRRAPPARVASYGEASGVSIFIASSTTSGWRASTRSPAATSTRITVPGIGAVDACSRRRPPARAWAALVDVGGGAGAAGGRFSRQPPRQGGVRQPQRRLGERRVLGQERGRRLARAHDRVRDEPAQERQVRRHAADLGLGERVARAARAPRRASGRARSASRSSGRRRARPRRPPRRPRRRGSPAGRRSRSIRPAWGRNVRGSSA